MHQTSPRAGRDVDRASDDGQLGIDVDSFGSDEELSLLDSRFDSSKQGKNISSWPVLVGMCTVAILICYADRSNISTAIIAMAADYSWDEAEKGVVLGAFFWGYAATQLLGGRAADQVGGKHVLSAGVAVWSACTCITPLAASLGTGTLLLSRVAMGLGEGIAFPAIHSLIAQHVPVSSRSTSVAVITAASYLGTALAFGVAPTIINLSSWQWVFYLFGASAILWLPLWLLLPLPPRVPAPAPYRPISPGSPGGTPRAPATAASSTAAGRRWWTGLRAPRPGAGPGASDRRVFGR